jgi:hypothetical protein
MKRTAAVIAVALLLAAMLSAVVACGGGTTISTDETTTSLGPSGGLVTTSSNAGTIPSGQGGGTVDSSTDTTAAASTGGKVAGSDQVFQPHELLSAEEASAITTFAVTLDEGSLSKDEESGTISERYSYDLNGTGTHALVEIHQDSFRTGDGSVKDVFLFEKDLGKAEITPVAGLGDDAFTHGQGQLHLLYGGYYIVVAFDADPYGNEQNAPLNIKLGTKILENLKAKLG